MKTFYELTLVLLLPATVQLMLWRSFNTLLFVGGQFVSTVVQVLIEAVVAGLLVGLAINAIAVATPLLSRSYRRRHQRLLLGQPGSRTVLFEHLGAAYPDTDDRQKLELVGSIVAGGASAQIEEQKWWAWLLFQTCRNLIVSAALAIPWFGLRAIDSYLMGFLGLPHALLPILALVGVLALMAALHQACLQQLDRYYQHDRDVALAVLLAREVRAGRDVARAAPRRRLFGLW